MRFIKYFVVSILMLYAFWAQADTLLKFGVYTADKPSAVVRQFRPLLNVIESEMSQRLGEQVKIKMQVTKTYEKGIQDIVKGNVDFSRFGPASYITASRQNPKLTILAMESKKGKKRFNGVICVAKDSSIQKVQDLKGKRFAFGNKLSTIGRFLSQLYLVEHGIKESDLSNYEYLGRHDKVGTAVAIGKFDAGALKESTFKKLLKKGHPLRALAIFPNVTKPWIARSGLSEKIRRTLSETLLHIKDSKALKALVKDGFLPGSDKDYAIIRSSMNRNNEFFK
jgi:phosphonate transport system substrate-binding protein